MDIVTYGYSFFYGGLRSDEKTLYSELIPKTNHVKRSSQSSGNNTIILPTLRPCTDSTFFYRLNRTWEFILN